MGYIKNLFLFTVFSLIIAGCGGGNTTISDNSAATNTSNNTTGSTGSGATTGTSGGTTSSGSGTSSTGTAILKWTAPSSRTDNTAVSLSDISAYRLYYGTSATNTPNSITITDATATQYTITLPSGTYYFRISAIDANGYEGLVSGAVQKSL